MKRVAAIDCGTNSIRLLVADIDPATGELTELDRRMRIVRLGQGVDRTGRFAPEALERTFAACREYAAVIKELGAGSLRFVATSASRDVENRADFVQGVLDILGVEPEVITGDQEAEFSFTGATRELVALERGAGAERPSVEGGGGRRVGHVEKPYLVVDIGGGSTEFVVGEEHAHPSPTTTLAGGSPRLRPGGPPSRHPSLAARSVDIGCVRMTERHLVVDGRVTDPPAPEQVAAIEADVEAALALAEETVPLTRARTLVGLAGSVTTVAAIALGLPEYDSTVVHHARISYDQVRDITTRLLASTHADRVAIPVIHPGRVDVITAGAVILLKIMDRIGAEEVVVSEHDILDGIAFAAAADEA